MLSAMMFLLSIMSCQQSTFADKRTNHYSLPWLLLSVALGGAAMMCKEQGITSIGVNLILVMMSTDYRQLQELFTDSNWLVSLMCMIKLILKSDIKESVYCQQEEVGRTFSHTGNRCLGVARHQTTDHWWRETCFFRL